jgi:hypothetical protein
MLGRQIAKWPRRGVRAGPAEQRIGDYPQSGRDEKGALADFARSNGNS